MPTPVAEPVRAFQQYVVALRPTAVARRAQPGRAIAVDSEASPKCRSGAPTASRGRRRPETVARRAAAVLDAQGNEDEPVTRLRNQVADSASNRELPA